MTKFKKYGRFAAGIITLCTLHCAFPTGALAAAAVGFDQFEPLKAIVLTPPAVITQGGPFTNTPVLIRGLDGIAKIDACIATNTGTLAGTNQQFTLGLYVSNDTTNWTLMTNFAYVTNTTAFATSNSYDGYSINSTNNMLFPFASNTTPTAASAGFATQYQTPLPYTNGGLLTLTNSASIEIGFSIPDQPAYMEMVWTPAGKGVTNATVFAVLTAAKKGN